MTGASVINAEVDDSMFTPEAAPASPAPATPTPRLMATVKTFSRLSALTVTPVPP